MTSLVAMAGASTSADAHSVIRRMPFAKQSIVTAFGILANSAA
jgi:hypothetical protein